MQHAQIAIMSERRTSMLAALLTAIGPFSMSIYTPAMPELAVAFSTPEAAIKMTLSVYFGGFAVAQLVAGPVSDAFGRRKATIIFMLLYMIGSLLAAFAYSVEMLIIGRLVQGIGAAVGQTVSRAIIRDQFAGQQASRIMNMTAIILAIAPALAPTLGGFMLASMGWRAIFFTMLIAAIISLTTVLTFMSETTVPDRRKARPLNLLKAYGSIIINPLFFTGTVVVAAAVGALYTLATILPFILIDQVGLSPTQFGVGMLMQSGMFFSGSLLFRPALKVYSAQALVVVGLGFIALGSIAAIVCGLELEASYLSVMIPVGLYAFGIAFVIPHLMIASLQPFPHIAGSASSMMGFLQMGTGLLGGFISTFFTDPHTSLYVLLPAMGAICIVAYAMHSAIAKRAAGKIGA